MPEFTLTEAQYNKLLDPRFGEFINQILNQPTTLNAPVLMTEEAATLYVSSTGDDDNDGLSESNALATLAKARSLIPKFIRHAVVVNVGIGTFDSLDLWGFTILEGGSLTVQGTLGQPTLTTGTATGTATGGSTTTLVDSGQSWTTNELRGCLVKVGTEYKVVYSNDDTNIVFAGKFGASTSGKAYEILEQKTLISGTGSFGYGPCMIVGCQGVSSASVIVKNFKATAGTVPFCAFRTAVGSFIQCRSENGYYGLAVANGYGGFVVNDCYVTGATSHGIWLNNFFGNLGTDGCYAYDNGGAGIVAESVSFCNGNRLCSSYNTGSGLYVGDCPGWVDVDTGIFDYNSKYGIEVDTVFDGNQHAQSTLIAQGSIQVANNTLGGIIGDYKSNIMLTACTGGSNGGYGIVLKEGSVCEITSGTTVTGTSGNATINNGNTVLSYATHFASNGDRVTNTDNLCTMVRDD